MLLGWINFGTKVSILIRKPSAIPDRYLTGLWMRNVAYQIAGDHGCDTLGLVGKKLINKKGKRKQQNQKPPWRMSRPSENNDHQFRCQVPNRVQR